MAHLLQYEQHFRPLFQAQLAEWNFNLPPFDDIGEVIADLGRIRGPHARVIATDDFETNPFLVTSRPFSELARRRGLGPGSYLISGKGLIYREIDSLVQDAESERQRAFRVIDYAVSPPTLLLRGQRVRCVPQSPLLRTLLAPPADIGQRLRLPRTGLFHPGLSANVAWRTMNSNERGSLPDDPGVVRAHLPTPFHLLLKNRPTPARLCMLYSRYIADTVMWCTLNALSDSERMIFVKHLTDFELPTPVISLLGLPQDFTPNPFVSVTADLGRAILYASGYFQTLADKVDVDWDKVAELCARECDGKGFVYALLIRRHVLPIWQLSQAGTIGHQEREYGVPCRVRGPECRSVIPVAGFVRALGKRGLVTLLRDPPRGKETAKILRRARDA